MTKELKIIEEARSVVITNSEGMSRAVELLSSLNKMADSVKKEREKLTKPLNEALREVRAKYKPIEEALEGSIGVLRSEMTRYQTEGLKARQEAELRLAERVEKGTLKMETAVKRLEGMESVEKTVKAEEGSVTFVGTEKFEVVDIGKLPVEYLIADEVKIRRAMKEGVKIEGVRYWKEQLVRNKR